MSYTDKTVQRYLDAMPCDSYRLQIVSFMGEENPASFPAKFEFHTAAELLKRVSYLKYRNWQGFNVYCRPNSTEYVLVDDVKREHLLAVSELKPCVLLETSPDNFQVFLRLQQKPAELTVAKATCQELARLFGGDLNAANPMQVGRLPGFTNRKAKHIDKRGDYPYVVLHGAENRFATFSPSGGACLAGASERLPQNGQKLPSTTASGMDRSREDFKIACRMVQEGCFDEDIYHVLIQREKGRERGRSYVNFTIKNARRATEKYRNH
jgi:hypothetical protein